MRFTKYFILFLLVSITKFSFSQEDYSKLQKLFEEEKYEDCAYKADLYTQKDKTSGDAEPYIYLAKCYWEISQLDLVSEYPKSFDDAFKYAYKGRKKDKDGTMYEKHKAFFMKLKEEGIKEASNNFKSGSYSHAAKYLKKVLKFQEEDDYLRLTYGLCLVLSKSTGPGSQEIQASLANIANNLYPKDNMNGDLEYMLAEAFAIYIDQLKEETDEDMLDSSSTTLGIAKEVLKGNARIQGL